MNSSFLTQSEIKQIGLKKVGRDVQISRHANFYNAEAICIGDSVRIDDFCILSGKISLGSFIHISAYCSLYGRSGISLGNYCGLSPRVTIFSESDDFSGEHLVGPMVSSNLRNVIAAKVVLSDFVQIGASSIVFPGVILGQGCAVGAMSLVNRSFDGWNIIAGIPARKINTRSRNLIDLIKP